MSVAWCIPLHDPVWARSLHGHMRVMQCSVRATFHAHSTVHLHTLKPWLRSWCSCMAVTLSMLFIASRITSVWRKKCPAHKAMLPWLPQDGPSAHGNNLRMHSLPAIVPSSANSPEMTGGLCLFSEETQNPWSRVVAKDHLHAATELVGLSGRSAELTRQWSSDSDG